MFLDKKLEPACLFPVTFEDYKQWLSVKLENYASRQRNLDASSMSEINSTSSNAATDENPINELLFLEPNEFCFRIELENTYFGIQPKQSAESRRPCVYDFSLCNCNKPAADRLNKQIKYKAAFKEQMMHPNSPEFRLLRYSVEKEVSVVIVKKSHETNTMLLKNTQQFYLFECLRFSDG